MHRRLAVVLAVLGVLLVSAAGVVRWVVGPAMSKLPSDTATTRLYAGQAAAFVNPTFATDVPSGPGILHDVPIAVRHTTTVLDTTSSRALVADRRVVTLAGGVAADLNYRYGVDRKSFEAVGGFRGVVAANGLTFNWPMNAKPHDYVGWVQDTLMTTPLHYVATVRHGGIKTYEFTAQAGDQLISDPVLNRMLPATMSKTDMLRLTPSLGLSHRQLLALDKVMAKAPDPVPLGYTYRFSSTFWIAPDSGIVVDMRQHDVRTTNIVTGDGLVPVAPVMDMTYAFTPSTVAGAVDDAKSAANLLDLVNTTLPVAALLIGLALLVASLVLAVPRGLHPRAPDGPWVEDLLHHHEVLH
jgi:hypothetical protein